MKEFYKSQKTVEIFKQQNNVMAVTHRSFSSYHSVPVTYRSLVGIEVAYIKLYEVISADTTERTNIYYMWNKHLLHALQRLGCYSEHCKEKDKIIFIKYIWGGEMNMRFHYVKNIGLKFNHFIQQCSAGPDNRYWTVHVTHLTAIH